MKLMRRYEQTIAAVATPPLIVGAFGLAGTLTWAVGALTCYVTPPCSAVSPTDNEYVIHFLLGIPILIAAFLVISVLLSWSAAIRKAFVQDTIHSKYVEQIGGSVSLSSEQGGEMSEPEKE